MTRNVARTAHGSGPVDWRRLDELKAAIQTAQDFGDVWRIFFDHFGENEEFLSLGQEVTDPALNVLFERALQSVGRHHLRTSSVTVSRMLLLELREQRFIHGPAMVNGYAATVIYFEDLLMGMILLGRRGSAIVHYSRFSLSVSGRDDVPLPHSRGPDSPDPP